MLAAPRSSRYHDHHWPAQSTNAVGRQVHKRAEASPPTDHLPSQVRGREGREWFMAADAADDVVESERPRGIALSCHALSHS